MSPDPIFHPHMSPYVGMDANPVALSDPYGLATGDPPNSQLPPSDSDRGGDGGSGKSSGGGFFAKIGDLLSDIFSGGGGSTPKDPTPQTKSPESTPEQTADEKCPSEPPTPGQYEGQDRRYKGDIYTWTSNKWIKVITIESDRPQKLNEAFLKAPPLIAPRPIIRSTPRVTGPPPVLNPFVWILSLIFLTGDSRIVNTLDWAEENQLRRMSENFDELSEYEVNELMKLYNKKGIFGEHNISRYIKSFKAGKVWYIQNELPNTINWVDQNKHWGPNAQQGRSILTEDPNNLLLDIKSGNITLMRPDKKRDNWILVKFTKTIGTHYDYLGNPTGTTEYGIIHYGKKGLHIVPANPNQY